MKNAQFDHAASQAGCPCGTSAAPRGARRGDFHSEFGGFFAICKACELQTGRGSVGLPDGIDSISGDQMVRASDILPYRNLLTPCDDSCLIKNTWMGIRTAACLHRFHKGGSGLAFRISSPRSCKMQPCRAFCGFGLRVGRSSMLLLPVLSEFPFGGVELLAGTSSAQTLHSSCDEFAEQIRLFADVPFLVLAFFDPTLRKFTCFSFVRDTEFPAERFHEVTAGAQRRLAIFSTAVRQDGKVRDLAGQTPSAQGFPVWIEDSGCLLGVAQPIMGIYPVVGVPNPAEFGKSIDPKLVKLCFTYLSQSLARSLYSNPTWPHALVETTLKVLSIEFFMVTASGEILVDGRARDSADTGGWQIVNNHLTVPDDRERAALRDAIRTAATAPGKASIISITMEPGTVRLSAVAPVQSLDEGLAVVLFERRNTDHFTMREHFFRAYGLTKSESLVAHEVLDGKSMAEAAAKTHFALETARSYMKAILVKTGTHRQQELISLYYSSILPIGRTIAAAENRRLHSGPVPVDKARAGARDN